MGRRLVLKQCFILPMTELFSFSKQRCKLVLVLNLFQPPKLQIRIPNVGRQWSWDNSRGPAASEGLKRKTTRVSAELSLFWASRMEVGGLA